MEQMETVIQRLSEIERAAIGLETMAAEQKKEIAAEYEQKTKDFDQMMETQTEEKLRKLNEKLEKEAQEELFAMRKKTEQILADMEQEYSQNHRKLAGKLLKQIIGE